MRETRIGPGPHTDGDSGIAEANSLYATDAEMFGSITPFLKKNRIKDARRRNYVIQAGGACIYFEGSDPYGEKSRVDFPSEKESFGHNSMDGNKLAQGSGRSFSMGRRGDL